MKINHFQGDLINIPAKTKLLVTQPIRELNGIHWLQGVSHIIVDEIHERGINEDLLLVILRDLLPRRPALKLILMSATLDAASFLTFFPGAATLHIPGFMHPVEVSYLDDVLERSGVQFKAPASSQQPPVCIPCSGFVWMTYRLQQFCTGQNIG